MASKKLQPLHRSLTPEEVKPEDILRYRIDELKIRIETYRSYFNLALQINAFFYLTTGGVLAFYLKEPKEQPAGGHLVYFLLLPILLGSVLGGVFFYGARLQEASSKHIEKLRRGLNAETRLDIEEIPDIHLLRLLLMVFGVIFFFVTAALIGVPLLTRAESWDKPTIATIHSIFFTVTGSVILVAGLCLGLVILPLMAGRFDKRLDADLEPPSQSADKP